MADDKIPIFIADPDENMIQGLLQSDAEFRQFEVDYAQKGATAQGFLKENRGKYKFILISPAISNPSGLAVLRFALQYHPTTPIYVTSSMTEQMDVAIDEGKLGLAGSVAKPFTGKDLLKVLGPGVKYFDSQEALKVSEQFNDKVDEEIQAEDLDFQPIKAELFISGSKSLFDVYVKLRADKFIKILQAGDNFDYNRLLEYLNKGVEYFYIRKAAQESYINYCDKLTKAISSHEKVPLDKKFSFLFNQCEITINTLSEVGVDNETIAYSQKYTHNVMSMVDKLAQKNDFLAGLLKELAQFEHSASVVVVSAMVAKAMGIETEKSLSTLGVAAMLHDIGLYSEQEGGLYDFDKDRQKFFNEEDIEEKLASDKMPAEKKAMLQNIYRDHPMIGATMLASVGGLNPLVAQIVQQHHAYEERENGTYRGGQIHPLAEILAISDTFVKVLKRFRGQEVNPQYLKDALRKKTAIYPRRVRDAFNEVIPVF